MKRPDLSAFGWFLAFLALLDFAFGRLTHYKTPTVVTDRENLEAVLASKTPPDVLVLGSSRAREFKPLEKSYPDGSLRVIYLSAGGFSSFDYLVRRNLAGRYDAAGRWPGRIVIPVHPRDFIPTRNLNVAAVLWTWPDFFRHCLDGIGDMEKNFLRARFLSAFRFSQFALERSELLGRRAFAHLLKGGDADQRESRDHDLDLAMIREVRAEVTAAGTSPDDREKENLESMLAFLRSKSLPVTVLFMPLPPSVDSGLAAEAEAPLMDLCRKACTERCDFRVLDSRLLGLSDAHFMRDYVHLNGPGRTVLVKHLLDHHLL